VSGAVYPGPAGSETDGLSRTVPESEVEGLRRIIARERLRHSEVASARHRMPTASVAGWFALPPGLQPKEAIAA
jgi:hypothetical protein